MIKNIISNWDGQQAPEYKMKIEFDFSMYRDRMRSIEYVARSTYNDDACVGFRTENHTQGLTTSITITGIFIEHKEESIHKTEIDVNDNLDIALKNLALLVRKHHREENEQDCIDNDEVYEDEHSWISKELNWAKDNC